MEVITVHLRHRARAKVLHDFTARSRRPTRAISSRYLTERKSASALGLTQKKNQNTDSNER
jgi:hypothetical protein